MATATTSLHKIKIINSYFIDCHSPTCGGGIRIYCSASKSVISGCSLISCSADEIGYDTRGSGGGAFIVSNGTSISRCLFEDCKGTSLGQSCFISSSKADFSCCSDAFSGKNTGQYPNLFCFEVTNPIIKCFNTTNSQFDGKYGILHVTSCLYEMKYIYSNGVNSNSIVIASSTAVDGTSKVHHSVF